jgi:hypothetical protein
VLQAAKRKSAGRGNASSVTKPLFDSREGIGSPKWVSELM